MEPLTEYEEKKWEEHKRFLDMQKNRVKIFESPDGGDTVFERYFGESERRQIKPEQEQINEDGTVPPGYPAKISAEVEMHNSEEDKKSAFVQYGKDEHEVFINPETLELIADDFDEMIEPTKFGDLGQFEESEMYNPEDGMLGEPSEYEEDHEEDAFIHDEPSEEEEEKWWVEKGMVDHPPHYNKGIETSEYIRSWEMNWDQANVIKYVTRYNLKHADKAHQCQDLRKARHYLDRLIESYEEDE